MIQRADDIDFDTIVRVRLQRRGRFAMSIWGGRCVKFDPIDFVVIDRHCKVFSANNLNGARRATFATSSEAIQTLAIVALALRLASHLGSIASRAPAGRMTQHSVMVN